MRALLVDFGGVLTSNVFDSFRKFCVREGLAPDAVKRLFKEDPEALALLRRLETGDVEQDDFAREFGARLGIEETDGLVERMFAGMGPDEDMLGAVRRARESGLRTGLISNSWGQEMPGDGAFDDLFDAVVISGQVGLHKPQGEIFELAAERVGVPPDECVFVDDLRENCAGAEAVGMTSVLHRGADRTLPELERLLGRELR